MKIRFQGFKRLVRVPKLFKLPYQFIKKHVGRSLRLQLILTFLICFVVGGSVLGITHGVLEDLFKQPYVDYTDGMDRIDHDARWMVQQIIDSQEANNSQSRSIEEIINDRAMYGQEKILLVDLNGKVLYKSENATETQVDIHNVIRNAMKFRIESDRFRIREEFYSVYPVTVQGEQGYLVVSGIPQGEIRYRTGGEEPFAFLAGVAAFIFLFYLLTRRKMRYIEELAEGLLVISKGNLDYRVAQKSQDELGSLANNINQMAVELQMKIEHERKTEKIKNELITNVSHDLRTPLTSIMGYLKLLMDKKYENQEQMDNYFQIVYGKTEKLKVLIEDLFEYTRLTDHNVVLHKERVCLNELLEQLMEELVPLCEENGVVFVKELPAERIFVSADPDKLARVFENLLTNAIKYSDKPGQIKVSAVNEEGRVIFSVQNKGAAIPKEDLPRVFDRFYRVDKSRTSATGGTGLGLAIAKSIVELHGGRIWAESEEGETRFLVELNTSIVR